MQTAHNIMTVEQLWAAPDDGQRHELVRRKLFTAPRKGCECAVVTAQLTGKLYRHVMSRESGVVFASLGGFVLSREPDTVRAPDAAFVKKENVPTTGIPVKYWDGAPDLAVEVVSPSDRYRDVQEKADDWLAAGTSLVWIIDPSRRKAEVFASPRHAEILGEDDQLNGDPVLPGFRCLLKSILV